MKSISKAVTMTLGAGVFVTMFASQASAGCGDLSNLQGPFTMAQSVVRLRTSTAAAKPPGAQSDGANGSLGTPPIKQRFGLPQESFSITSRQIDGQT